MNLTNRKPFSPDEILYEEFMQPLSLTQTRLAHLLKLQPRQISDHPRQTRHHPGCGDSVEPFIRQQCGLLVELAAQNRLVASLA